MNAIKTAVYDRLSIRNTRELKAQFPALAKGLDLRYKSSWEQILKNLDEAQAEFQAAFDELRTAMEATDAVVAKAKQLAA